MKNIARIFALLVGLLALGACNRGAQQIDWAKNATGGDPERGKSALTSYGCVACHTIDGIRSSDATVGPPLTKMASRTYLAGRLENTPANLKLWIQNPRQADSQTAMPDSGVSDSDARDIAAYLYTFK